MDLLFKDECYAIMGACFEVYNEAGCGFTEPIYQECLELELALQGIPFKAQFELDMTYKSAKLKQKYKETVAKIPGLIVTQ